MDHREQLDEIVSSFRRISHSFQQLLWKDAEQFGITPAQLMVLRKLSLCSEMSVTELAERMYLGNSSVSGLVERMVKAGLITRKRAEDDRRIFRLALTEKGKEIWEKSEVELRKHLLPLTHIPREDAQELLRIHGQIIEILEQGREQSEL
ncbi:MarR family winged helix-turn-helix transcriptional regulator [Paenibacillus sp. URB8-2]|uniref:MarR family winged helix-turn-helix transcriptional regulator n=1 Tax=Paenibacillus sp. URB8-2 TaxID=2741301 RepID=UPI0015BF78A2|nr:MarR family transcriptional regulator [Paenibacillus sp. URB8-2]BCG57244.1 putative HTH-type transcriptional regulator YusO [Paenibacillus sp. URB8-2]